MDIDTNTDEELLNNYNLSIQFISNNELSEQMYQNYYEAINLPLLYSTLEVDNIIYNNIFKLSLNKLFSSEYGIKMLCNVEFQTLIINVLSSESTELKLITLHLIKNIEKFTYLHGLFFDTPLFIELFNLCIDPSLLVVQNVITLFNIFTTTNNAESLNFFIKRLTSDDIINNIFDLNSINYESELSYEERNMRVLDLILQLITSSKILFIALINSKLITTINELFDFSFAKAEIDPLRYITLLEMLPILLRATHCYNYFIENRYLNNLGEFTQNPFFIIPLVKVVEELLKHSKLDNSSQWVSAMENAIMNSTPDIQTSAIYSLSKICATLSSPPSNIWNYVQECITRSDSELKIASIAAFTEVVHIDSYREILNKVGRHGFMWEFFTFAKNPIEDIRNSVFRFYSVVATHSWGLELFKNTPGLIEWLINRETEVSLVGIDWKYTIIQNLVQNPAFNEKNMNPLLKTFYLQGRIYKSRDASIKLEEMD